MDETDLLSEFEVKKKGNLCSRLSIVTALLTIVLICYEVIITPDHLKPGETIDSTTIQVISVSIVVLAITGIVLSICSLVRREKPAYIKAVGVTLNALLLLFLAAGIISVFVLETT